MKNWANTALRTLIHVAGEKKKKMVQVKKWTQNWNPFKRLCSGSLGRQLVYIRPFVWVLIRSERDI